MPEKAPKERIPSPREPSGSAELGQHLRWIRREIYDENLRDFAARVGLSPAYLSKIELAQVTPRRSTLEDVARKLGARPDELLIAAGYLPADTPASDVTRLLIESLSPGQQDLIAALARVLRDYDVTPREPATRTVTSNRKARGKSPRRT